MKLLTLFYNIYFLRVAVLRLAACSIRAWRSELSFEPELVLGTLRTG